MVEHIKNPIYRFLSSLIEGYAKKIPTNVLYDDYLRPMLFRKKGGIDILLLSECLRADEISELIESDYKYMQRIKCVCNDITKVLDNSC